MEVDRAVPLLRFLRILKKLTMIGLIFIFLSAVGITFSYFYLRSQPLPPSTIEQTTTIYASNGDVIDSLYGGHNRTVIPLTSIPKSMVNATVAIEDKNFYNHWGFDFLRLGKAVIVDIQHMSKVQGASTITQQLARNLYLTLDKTWERKLKEAMLTVQLELNYTKDQLMELYLNQIYYGHTAYGIQAAAQTYFGENASDLTLAQASMLAGIPKGPALFSPYLNMDQAKTRQKTVLNAMVDQHMITKDEANAAFAEPIKLVGLNTSDHNALAPYFRDYITQLVKEKYQISEDELIHGGLKIYTTLDPQMQKKAEDLVAKYVPKDRPLQAALIAMDPRTGEIKAWVGGKDYKKSQYNRVIAKRQPGSSFKPFLYLAALENGYTPLTKLKSEPTIFTYGKSNKTYAPKNFGEMYPNAEITLQQALAKSDNIYAVKTNMALGVNKLVDSAKRLGIESPLSPNPSLALGTDPVSPLEMATAYSTIANLGEKVQPVAIKKIVDSDGKVIVEEKPVVKTRVASAAQTYVLTQLMQGVFEEGGTGYRVAKMIKRPVAGKTGTTDYDSWLVGFTPQLTTAIWTGYDEGKKIDEVNDARLAAPLWAEFMESALADQTPALFPIPDGVRAVYINPQNDKLATQYCPTQKLIYFVDGTEPKKYCTEHIPKGKSIGLDGKVKEDGIWKKMFKWW